ncbi:unnamed protein product [Larinioides sclopetarius]|uniref:Uncharacterized protein n=1 Tax=Larinioides sclopetarius TaxID=280406 RepID=A0AAV1YQN6_9ARAC
MRNFDRVYRSDSAIIIFCCYYPENFGVG